MHRVIAIDGSSPEQSLLINAGGDVITNGKAYLGDTTPLSTLADGDAWVKGRLQAGGGLIARATDWGTSLFTIPSTGFGTTHVGTADFDLTGGALENYLTATPVGGWTFADGDQGKVILLLSGDHVGGLAIVEEIVDGTHVRLETCGWDEDFSGVSIIFFDTRFSFTSPQLKINNINPTSEWENVALAHTGSYATKLKMTSAGDLTTNLRIETEAGGYSNVDSITMKHTTGDLSATEISKAIRVTIDDSACTGGSTVDIDGLKFTRTKGDSTATVHAIQVGTQFTNALKVEGSAAEDPGYGYTFTALFAVTDHVNSGGGGDDSFINPAVNTQMFTADNTGILIGSDNQFAVIEYVQQVAGSATITPTWQYSTGDGTWATLPVSDTTTGMRFSGKVAFTPPAPWAKTSHCDGATGAITEAYYVRITRTANTLATPPTEQYFKIFQGASATDTLIRGDGTIKPAQLGDASAPNDSIYYSTTASKLVYKDPGGTVRNLY
jgi:hypothetical protein